MIGGKRARMATGEKASVSTLTTLANDTADKLSSDILFINHVVGANLDTKIIQSTEERQNRWDNLVVVLVTEGGDAHMGYRCMRYLQAYYRDITIVVPGWCKSAGTLMCTGAHRLQIGPLGELGPLDVQLLRTDSLKEVISGLTIDAAVEKLQQEASKTLMTFIKNAEQSDYRMSLSTAAEIAKTVTIGLFQPVFGKLEPISIGEDIRAYKVAEAYAQRLDEYANNLRRTRHYDGLQALLEAYPSHRFIIDHTEASSIFQNVHAVSRDLKDLIELLGLRRWFPLDRKAGENEIEYLNDKERVIEHVSDKAQRSEPAQRKRKSAQSASASPAIRARSSKNTNAGHRAPAGR